MTSYEETEGLFEDVHLFIGVLEELSATLRMGC